jgi:hypothetical protein
LQSTQGGQHLAMLLGEKNGLVGGHLEACGVAAPGRQ